MKKKEKKNSGGTHIDMSIFYGFKNHTDVFPRVISTISIQINKNSCKNQKLFGYSE